MELDEILNPWIQQLETAVKPYFDFVEDVSVAVFVLEETQRLQEKLQSSVASALNAPALTITGIDPGIHHALERKLEDQTLIHKSQQAKIEELNAQLKSLKSEALSAEALAVDAETRFKNELALATSKVAEEMAATNSSNFAADGIATEKFQALEREIEEQAIVRKSQQVKIDDLHSQIAVLKTALSEAKSAAESAMAGAREVSNTSTTSPRAPRVSQAKAPVFPERHVLLVDDAEINRVLMSHYFKGLPVKLEFAVSVTAALQKCKERKFDLIVVDDELQDLENPEFRATSTQLVGLSNRSGGHSTQSHFEHILNRGQARDAFIEQLKAYLWQVELIA